MALWRKVQKLTGDQIRTVQAAYGIHFPIEVRHYFSQWIEEQPWMELDENNREHEGRAVELRDLLLQQLEPNNASSDAYLREIAQQFREMYGNHPMNLIRVIKNGLQTELRMVQQIDEIQQLEGLEWSTQDSERALQEFQRKVEAWLVQSQKSNHLTAQLSQLSFQAGDFSEAKQRVLEEKGQVDGELSSAAPLLLFDYMSLLQMYQKTCMELEAVHSHIVEYLRIPWNRQQQIGINPSALEGGLDTMQQWYDSLADLTWRNHVQIEQAGALRARLPLEMSLEQQGIHMLVSDIKKLLETVITNSFVIEKQPPQVLKKDARFSATVRCLIGRRRHMRMTLPEVTATIVSENKARSIIEQGPGAKSSASGDIDNNKGIMEYMEASDQMSITFRNMSLKRIHRAEKRGNETVTEEKSSIFFEMKLTVNTQLNYQFWTLSLPVVVTVHGNQECNAQATVLWDNAFAETVRIPFQVPDQVPWPELAQALNDRFVTQCSLELDEKHLLYLGSKLLGSGDDFSRQVVTWSQFNREPLPGRSFTFWEWFYSILKLTKDWLIGPWKDKLILGFISKQRAEDWLMKAKVGTFLLRFSDSELGGLSFAWVQLNENGEPFVRHLSPYTDKDFRTSGLGDRIKDPDCLIYLFPDIPKEDVFAKFWTSSAEKPLSLSNGYVKPDLTTRIPGTSPAAAAAAAPAGVHYDGSSQNTTPLSPTPSEDMNCSVSSPPVMQTQKPFSRMNLEQQLCGPVQDDLISDLNMLDYTPDNIDEISASFNFTAHQAPLPPPL